MQPYITPFIQFIFKKTCLGYLFIYYIYGAVHTLNRTLIKSSYVSKPLIPLPENEEERLAALKSYNILDTGEEEDFDELTTWHQPFAKPPLL
jgi:hypothetical protein